MKSNIFQGNCLEVMRSKQFREIVKDKVTVIVTDPPFNIGYHYKTYKDKMKENEYLDFLSQVLGGGVRARC